MSQGADASKCLLANARGLINRGLRFAQDEYTLNGTFFSAQAEQKPQSSIQIGAKALEGEQKSESCRSTKSKPTSFSFLHLPASRAA
jgi:hypothetical protein